MKQNYWKTTAILLAIILVITFAVLITEKWFLPQNSTVYSYIFGRQPSDVVKDYYQAVCDGDLDRAVKHTSAGYLNSLGFLPYSVRGCKEAGGLETVTVESELIENEKALVIGQVKFKNNTSISIKQRLYYEKGEWKMAQNLDTEKND